MCFVSMSNNLTKHLKIRYAKEVQNKNSRSSVVICTQNKKKKITNDSLVQIKYSIKDNSFAGLLLQRQKHNIWSNPGWNLCVSVCEVVISVFFTYELYQVHEFYPNKDIKGTVLPLFPI